MSKKRTVPEVRFRGFEREWEERRVSSLSELTFGGGTPSTSNKEFWNGEIPWIQSSDLIEDDVLHVNPCKFITTKGLQKSATKVVPNDSIAIVTRVGVGKLALVPFRYTTSQDFFSLASLNIEKIFCTYLLHILMQKEQYSVQGTSIKGITKEDLLNKKSFVSPIKTEQTRIGELFRNLDALITLEQRKHEKLQNIKKAMLEKMFPKPGATEPEVRFKGFEGEWEEKRLGEVADIIGGGTPSTSNPSYWSGDIDWYSPTEIGKDVYADRSVKKITNLGLEKSAAKLLPANKTVLFTSRAGIGDMAILRNVAATNQGFQSLVLKGKIDTYFIYSMGILIKAYAEKNASGSTFLEIYGKVLANMPVLLPCETEQTRIGEFFRNLDRLLSLQQRKCEKLQNIKKAMLGKMFV